MLMRGWGGEREKREKVVLGEQRPPEASISEGERHKARAVSSGTTLPTAACHPPYLELSTATFRFLTGGVIILK